jgi:hypothetical protein
MDQITPVKLPPAVAQRIISLREASLMTSLSSATLKRRFPDLVVKLTERRKGMRFADALAIAQGQQTPSAA